MNEFNTVKVASLNMSGEEVHIDVDRDDGDINIRFGTMQDPCYLSVLETRMLISTLMTALEVSAYHTS